MAALALVVSVGAYLATAAAIAAMGPDPVRPDVELVQSSDAPEAQSWRTETEIGEGFGVGFALADDFAKAWWQISGISGGHLLGVGAGIGVVVATVVGTGRFVRRRVDG